MKFAIATTALFATVATAAMSPDAYLDCVCPDDTVLATVSFDEFANHTLVPTGGAYVSDFGFGFKVTVQPGPGGLATTLPRIFNSNDLDPTSPDTDLQVLEGNLLIIQQDGDVRPNDNAKGGKMVFAFEEPTTVLGLQLIDTIPRIQVDTLDGTIIARPTNGQVVDHVVAQANVTRIQVTLPNSGAIGRLLICRPKELCDDEHGDTVVV